MQDLVDATDKQLRCLSEQISLWSQEKRETIGNIALEKIADYPLYACSSNISYEEAIIIGVLLFGKDLLEEDDGSVL